MIYSGKGASLDQVFKRPPANEAGCIYINHTGNHYEPVLTLSMNKLNSKQFDNNPLGLMDCYQIVLSTQTT